MSGAFAAHYINAKHMEAPYYLGGYYLVKPKSLGSQYNEGRTVHTTSQCISRSLIGPWAYSWGATSKEDFDKVKNDLELNAERIQQIQEWADQKFESRHLQWVADFTDLDTAIEYKQTFFSHLDGVHIYSIYLSASDTDHIVSHFENEQHNHGRFTLRRTLAGKIKEQENTNEVLLGYDLIGVEFDGGYHTFYCHHATQKLIDRFGLTLNANGLFDEIDDWQPVKDYINQEKNGFEPVPWYVAKTKMLTTPAGY